MVRIVLVVVVLLALVAGAAFLMRAPLAIAVMERAAARNLASDPVGELPDGLHVALCGAGGPLADPLRSGPCVAVIAGRTLVVVDAGTGGARNLARMGFSPGAVDAVFLTHFHSDHIDGLGELALQRWTNAARRERLPVYGPDGVERVVDGFNRAYALDAGYRTAHHGEAVAPSSGSGMEPRSFPAPAPGAASSVWERDGLSVRAFAVEHDPATPAVGYRFEYGGRVAVVSGDTRQSANVQRFSEGADLLVHEVLSARLVGVLNRAASAAGRDNLAKIMADIPSYHTAPAEAGEIATAAGVDWLLMYHVVPPTPVPGLGQVLVSEAADTFGGPITLGRDGTFVTLVSGGDGIDVSHRL